MFDTFEANTNSKALKAFWQNGLIWKKSLEVKGSKKPWNEIFFLFWIGDTVNAYGRGNPPNSNNNLVFTQFLVISRHFSISAESCFQMDL